MDCVVHWLREYSLIPDPRSPIPDPGSPIPDAAVARKPKPARYHLN